MSVEAAGSGRRAAGGEQTDLASWRVLLFIDGFAPE